MLRISLISLILMLGIISFSQDETVRDMQARSSREVKSGDSLGWNSKGALLMNLHQGALSNWAAGGEENVFGINTIINYLLNYKGEKFNWDNFLDFALGFQNATSFERFRKIDDRIDFTSKYGRKISSDWSAGLLFNFFSQMLAGYAYTADTAVKISNFLSPGRILLSPGFDFRPGTRFSLFISPATVRWIFKRDPDFLDKEMFGVEAGKKVATELGAFVTARYLAQFTSWALFSSRLDLFSNYSNDPQNIDILMNNLLTLKITRNLATSLSLDLIYDHDVIQKLQVKEILGIGLTLNF